MTDTELIPAYVPPQTDTPSFRSNEMYLMDEALARAHCMEQRERALHERQLRRLLAARRLERRAARAAQRAQRYAAAAVALHDRGY